MSCQSGDRDGRVLHVGSLSPDVHQQKQLLLSDLLCVCDAVSIHTPKHKQNTHMVAQGWGELMTPARASPCIPQIG